MNSNLVKALTQAREERDYLLNRPYITRDGLENFKNRLETNLVAVITGPRRAGKSVFALSALSGTEFIYLNSGLLTSRSLKLHRFIGQPQICTRVERFGIVQN